MWTDIRAAYTNALKQKTKNTLEKKKQKTKQNEMKKKKKQQQQQQIENLGNIGSSISGDCGG